MVVLIASSASIGDSWQGLLSTTERMLLEERSFGGRVGFGSNPALLLIDLQQAMMGERGGDPMAYPSACGPHVREVIERLVPTVRIAREARVPIVFTQLTFREDHADLGVYGSKRSIPWTDGWLFDGTSGVDFTSLIRPEPGDLIVKKQKFSAFFGTTLTSLLVDRRIDTLIIAGGTTSNCVRASALDAASYNFRTIVIADGVFDRFEISHRVALFDLDRLYADVVSNEDVCNYLREIGSRESSSERPSVVERRDRHGLGT